MASCKSILVLGHTVCLKWYVVVITLQATFVAGQY